MTRRDVHDVLEETPKEFAKGFSPNIVEAYNTAGVHVYYDDEELLEFVEAFSPSRPTYASVYLLRRDASEVVKDLAMLGLDVRRDGEGGVWFDDHGFALYAPDRQTEAVSVFRRGYDTGA